MLSLCAGLAQGAALERGLAVTDPFALRELDLHARGLNRMLQPAAAGNIPLTNDRLFALPAMAPVRKALDDEFARYVARRKTESPGESIGVGTSFDFQLFDRTLLDTAQARFVLAGIVNRMDRAYVAPQACGEMRLVYRLTASSPPAGEEFISPRLPMTLNIVLKAKGDAQAVSCAEIAARWVKTVDSPLAGPDLATSLMAAGGPLELVTPDNIDRIETNLQIAHAPKSELREFRTDYLLKVFHYDAHTRFSVYLRCVQQRGPKAR